MNNANNPAYNNHQQYNQNANGNPQDLSSAFGSISSLNPSQLDYGQFSSTNPQLQQARFGDATSRHQSPAYQHPGYQVNPVIPAKRSRGGNEPVSASPRPAPSQFSGTRSQTPQQQQQPIQQQSNQNPYGNSMGAQGFQNPPNAFPHMQHAGQYQHSPSPAPSMAPYNPQLAGHQRPSTNSPHLPNAGTPTYGGQPHAMGSARGNMPASTPQAMRPPQMSQGYNQSHPANTGQHNNLHGQQGQMTPGVNSQPQDPQAALQLQQQQQQYRMKLQHAQQQLQHNNVNQQERNHELDSTQNVNGSRLPAANVMNGHPSNRPSQPTAQGTPARPQLQPQTTDANFLARLQSFMQQQGQPLDPNPTVCGQPVNYYSIFTAVTNCKTLIPGPSYNNWTMAAEAMNLPRTDQAAQELEILFKRNLNGFVTTWMQMMNKRRIIMQQQNQQAGGRPLQTSPTSAVQDPSSAASHVPPSMQGTPSTRKASLPPSQFGQQQFVPVQAQNPAPMQRQPLGEIVQTAEVPAPPLLRKQSSAVSGGLPPPAIANIPTPLVPSFVSKQEIPDMQKPEYKIKSSEYTPVTRAFETYGGLPLPVIIELGDELTRVKPGMPVYDHMGNIDLHALTLSIQSGMHGEMRYALDQLLALSNDSRPGLALSLVDCEGLLDALVECAEEQLAFLESEAVQESDTIQLPYFEDLLVLQKIENDSLQGRAAFSSNDYERSQAAERFVAVTSIIRNISFADSAVNHDLLALPPLIVLLANAIRLLGTRSMLLHSSRNAADFMKDTVTLLSNIAHRIEIPGKDEAESLLNLLVAFTPSPPQISSTERVVFSFYDPAIHIYLPSAVDALAKLLARDEPNRTYCKALFGTDNSSSPPQSHLLTRTFNLAIAPIPDRAGGHLIGHMELRLAEARKPFFCQGMLAADILSSLVPGPDDNHGINLAQLWLESDDGWVRSLIHMVVQLTVDPAANGPPMRHPQSGRIMDHEGRGFALITRKALSMLKRLAAKVDRQPGVDGIVKEKTPMYKIGEETMVMALCNPGLDGETLRRMMSFAGLEA